MKTFLYGPAGGGKTILGVEHLGRLMSESSGGILVYVPQRTLAEPYFQLVQRTSGQLPDILTIGGLCRRMVELFWPMVAEYAGFGKPVEQPRFLNLEAAQYFMAQVVRPLMTEGLFESVSINRNRLYTQILDNLNKAALNGYGLDILGSRLKLGDIGDPEQVRIYQDALTAARAFRAYCLENSLLDFSLQLEIFTQFLWPEGSLCRSYLESEYQHFIVENIEETTPVEHDILIDWVPAMESALLIYDTEGGYRTFLGADPDSAWRLKDICEETKFIGDGGEANLIFDDLSTLFGRVLGQKEDQISAPLGTDEIDESFIIRQYHFFPDMLDGVADEIHSLVVDEGVPPSEIAVLSPFLSDALRYSLSEKLTQRGIRSHSHRPSRSLRDEAVSQALHTLALLAHPEWKMFPTRFDLAYCLLQVISGIDLVRAQLLAQSVLSVRNGELALDKFNQLSFYLRERITYSFGEKYDLLVEWLETYHEEDWLPLDHFWSRLFGEVVSQPGFGYHDDLGVGEVAANLIDSARNFRWMNEGVRSFPDELGKEFLKMMQEGVIAAQYLRSWKITDEESVLMVPAYTFLMHNKPVEYQFWLDISSYGWHERIFQPVTHPFVLNRNWPIDRYWTDADEVEQGNRSLYRLVTGLLRRSRKGVFAVMSELSESGYESQGLLLKTLHRVYQQIRNENGVG